jgi:glycosyltransferase involved in cell wall biosynthesis
VRLGLDATPLIGRLTGVGRYVEGLLSGFTELGAEAPEQLALAAFTWRGGGQLVERTGRPRAGRRAPARALWASWRYLPVPRLEWLGVHCDVFHATNYVLPPSGRARGVVSVHDLSYLHHSDTVAARVAQLRAMVPVSVRRAELVLTLTEALADEVAEAYRLDRARVRCVPCGVDPAWLSTPEPDPAWRRRHGLPERYLLFVGTLEPRKNVPVLLEALRLLGRDAPPLLLAGAAGWGPPPELRGLPAGAVHQLGYVDQAQLRATVAGAAALVFPSRHEGFGLPPLEALACGTPVVSSDLPALREVTGEQARYAPVGDAAALAEVLAEVLTDPQAHSSAAREARRAHARRWTWRRCAEQAVAAYGMALG